MSFSYAKLSICLLNSTVWGCSECIGRRALGLRRWVTLQRFGGHQDLLRTGGDMSSDLTSQWLKWKLKKLELRLNPNWKWTKLAFVSNNTAFQMVVHRRRYAHNSLLAWFWIASLKLNVKQWSPLKGLWSAPVCLCVCAWGPLKMGLLDESRKAFTAALSGGYSAP